jgi:hypothetical protein
MKRLTLISDFNTKEEEITYEAPQKEKFKMINPIGVITWNIYCWRKRRRYVYHGSTCC